MLGAEPGTKDAEAEHQTPRSQLQPSVALELVCRIRSILLVVALGTLAAAVVGPSLQFIVTSFFAEDGGDCELHPKSKPCRRGAADLALYHGISNGLSHSVAWIMAMLLGSWSDAVGRRPFMRAKAVFSTLPAAALCLHVFSGATLWLYLVLSPMLFAFDNIAVFFASVNDLVTEPHLRSSAFGIMMGFFILVGGVVMPLGGILPHKASVAAYFAVTLAQVAYMFTCFPETLRESLSKNTPLGLRSVVRQSMEVFNRNSFIKRMVLVLVFSAFSCAGLTTVLPSYSTAYLGLNRKLLTTVVLAMGLSIALSLSLLLPRLVLHVGEVGAMKVSLAVAVVYPIVLPLCSNYTHYLIVSGLLTGPCVMCFPVISSIKSNLVGEDEQGIVQGALAAVRVLAVAISDPLFGWLYRFSTDSGERASRFSALPPIMLVAVLSTAAFLVSWGLPHQPPLPTKAHQAADDSTLEETELSTVSSSTD